MIEEIPAYKTYDGKVFENKTKATEHSLNAIRELLDTQLRPLLGKFTHADLYNIVMELVPDNMPANKRNMFDSICNILNYGD